jgi:hypothetical protein
MHKHNKVGVAMIARSFVRGKSVTEDVLCLHGYAAYFSIISFLKAVLKISPSHYNDTKMYRFK